MTGTVTLWVFGLLCFVVAVAKQAASGAGISLPGPETRGARIGVVLVGVLAIVLGSVVRSGGDGPGPKPPVSAADTAVTSASAPGSATPNATATATAAPATATPLAPTPAWSGSVLIPSITDSDDIEFDRIPPGPGPTLSQTGIYAGHDPYEDKWHLRNSLSGDNRLGVWTKHEPPTGAECSAWATTHPASTVEVTKGTMVCLDTPDGHTALLTIDSLSADDSRITATATVWPPS